MKSDSNSDILWAPWRMEYILGEKESGCIFCTRINQAQEKDKENLILYRGEYSFIIMNKYPYNNGHVMVVPNRHMSELEDLSFDEKLEVMNNVSKSVTMLKKRLNPDGFNIGANIGKFAGAGIDDHLHFHVVPRWTADTNFMPVTGETKVISEGLAETWQRLQAEF